MLITVPSTQLVEVADLDMSEEVYRGGDEPRTLRWEVWNRGNQVDRYRLSFEHLNDVNVDSGEAGDLTPWIQPGASFNVTASYSFDSGTFGERVILMHASSDAALQAFEDRIGVWRTRLLSWGLPRRASHFMAALERYDGYGISG